MNCIFKFMERLANGAYKKPILFISCLIVITILSIYAVSQLKMDNSNESFFVEGDPFLAEYKQYQERYGSDEFIYLILDFGEQKFFSKPENLDILNDITDQLKEITYNGQNLVDEVLSLANIEYITGSMDVLEVSNLIDFENLPDDYSVIQDKALKEDFYLDSLISSDGTKVGVIVNTIQLPNDGKFRKFIASYVEDLTNTPEYEGKVKITAVGVPIIDAAVDLITGEQFVIFLLLAILLNIVLLWFTYRTLYGVLAPLTVVVLSVLLVLGAMFVFKIPVSMVSTVIPPLLMAVSIGASIHLLHEYRTCLKGNPEEAFLTSVKSKIYPCFFTSLTTIAGFLSLTTARVKPVRQLGIYSAMGVFFAFLLTFIIVPLFMRKIKAVPKVIRKKVKHTGHLDWISAKVYQHPGKILVITALISIAAVLFIPKVVVESNFVKIFKENLQVRQDYDYVDQTMGGSNSIEVLINTGQYDGVKDTAFLKKVDEYQQKLKNEELVFKVFGLVDIVKKLNQVLNGNESSYYVVPDTNDFLAQSLFLYEISKDNAFKGMVDDDFREIHLTVRLKNTSTEEFRKLSTRMDELAKEVFGEQIHVSATGTVPIFIKMAEYITVSQLQSFMFAFVVIALMMMLSTKSVAVGLLSMIPNILPIVIMFGFMGVTRIPLDFMTVLTCSIAIGVAVDNTIHIISGFRKFQKSGSTVRQATQENIQLVGNAVISSSLTLGAGFLIMGASQVTSIANFGILSALTVFTALLADLFVTPSILVIYYRWKTKKIMSDKSM